MRSALCVAFLVSCFPACFAQHASPIGHVAPGGGGFYRSNSFFRKRLFTERNTKTEPSYSEYPKVEWAGKQLIYQMLMDGPKTTFGRGDKLPINSVGRTEDGCIREILQVINSDTMMISDGKGYKYERIVVKGFDTSKLSDGERYDFGGEYFKRLKPGSYTTVLGANATVPTYEVALPPKIELPFIHEWHRADGTTFKAMFVDYEKGKVGFIHGALEKMVVKKSELSPDDQSLISKFVRARFLFRNRKKVPDSLLR